MDKICLFSNEQIEILKNKYPNNKPLQDKLDIIKKYNNIIDNDYL
jgi:antirestriction protein ArdC